MSEEGSSIGRRLRATGKMLLGGAERQVKDYQERFKGLEKCYDDFLSRLLNSYSSVDSSVDFIDHFFGKRDLRFGGIDGTLHKYDVFDLLIFFAGAYSSEGSVSVADDGSISVTYEEKYLDKGIGISSVLPVHISEVPRVDQTLLVRDEDGEVDDSITFADSWIVDNSAFADYLMGLSEFFLALKLVSKEDPVDILLLDRICSSEISSFYAETSEKRVDLDRESGLIGHSVKGRPFTKNDWIFARRLIGNTSLKTPPPRGEYLLPAIITELMKKGSGGLTRDELESALGINNDSRRVRLDKELADGIRGRSKSFSVLTRKGEHYMLLPEYRDLKERLALLVEEIAGRIFSEDESIDFEDRFKVDGRWITTIDLAFLSLSSLFLTMEKCWSENILMIGVAKDSSARDLKRQLLPVLNFVGEFSGGFDIGKSNTPDTDRMILQWVSLHERTRLSIPWATLEYDTAFKTIVPHFDGVKGKVSGARRNQISIEKTFLKSYFQLCEAESEPKLRSNVLLYDRLIYPGFDTDSGQTKILEHDYNNDPNEPEPVEVVVYLGQNNPIQSFVIRMFKEMTSQSIPDLFGHIKPLFIADKVAKFYYSQFKNMVEGTGAWLINKRELREFLFYLSTFRERRTDIEQTRRTS